MPDQVRHDGLSDFINRHYLPIAIVVIAVSILFVFPFACQSAPQEALRSAALKLDAWDVEEAWVEVKGLLEKEPKDLQLLNLASEIAFHRGDYQEALRLARTAAGMGEDERRNAFALFVEQTIGVVGSFKRYESPHFIITLDEKQDEILAGYLIDTMEKTYRVMAEQYGFQTKEKIRIEIFPDTRAFYYASTLSVRDIEVTGAVGLAKFNKLMVLSPRALVYGYRWLDAISHEYMHYLIVRVTANKAPIWFHEGLAKYEETRWRNGPSYLSALNETLLARALADKKLIGFEQMEPSLIKLDTPEDVQLAYAQAASAIEFIIARAGYEGLREVMKKMATSGVRGASGSIMEVLGLGFEGFQERWKEFLASKGLKEMKGVKVRRYKIKEGRADEERLDMEEIKSMVARNRAHLGDRLKERGRTGAAVLEYRRALSENPDSVPVMNRLSSVLAGLGQNQEALQLLKRSQELSPDHPTTHTDLGQTYLRVKDFKGAKEAFQTSIQLNPFDPEVHQGLATALEVTGEESEALKEREIARKLRR
jgi:Flp pilus assembly protein TadD